MIESSPFDLYGRLPRTPEPKPGDPDDTGLGDPTDDGLGDPSDDWDKGLGYPY